jgi:hypothetical protein
MNVALRQSSSLTNILVGIFSFLLAFPLFILCYRRLPDLQWPYGSDKLLYFFVIAVLLVFLIRSFRLLLIIVFGTGLAWLGYGTVSHQYGFRELYEDSRSVLSNIQSGAEQINYSGSRSLPYDKDIINAVDYKTPAVRDFAIASTNEFFKKEQKTKSYRTLIQCFAIFKKINSNWNYVNDPKDEEYIARASESVKLLAGDCDDHSILMAAAIKAVGGTPRLVYTKGHIYPEILIGNRNDLAQISKLIRQKLFASESYGQSIHYHKDDSGRIWLNLDYTADYPGGNFMGDEVIEALYP